jgi:hypothetical protein
MTIQQMFFGISGALGNLFQRSVRLRASASAYFNRTPASATDRKTWTWSAWIKRGDLANVQTFFAARPAVGGNPYTILYFSGSTLIAISDNGLSLTANNLLRDPSSWYHIVLNIDTTQATSSNRAALYINGILVSYSSAAYPAQNADLAINSTTNHYIGVNPSIGQYFDGYMTEVNFIDGQALTPTSFGEFNTITGVWQPKKYTGTYGTNGFYLNFQDNSGATATTIGKDSSGNGNNWTPNNISVTAGATYDSMTDVPTLTSATQSNFATLNPLARTVSPQATLSNANLTISSPGTTDVTYGSIGVSSGKYYWEVTPTTATTNTMIGIGRDGGLFDWRTANGYAYWGSNGNKYTNSTGTAYGASYTTNDVIGVALDMDAGTLTFYKNNASQGTAFSSLSGTFFPMISNAGGGASWAGNVNFGQRPFAYTPPTGFVALNSFNLPNSTITNGSNQFAATLWTGNGSSPRNITGLNFQPDFVWVKSRNAGVSHSLNDSVRGFGTTKNLQSNTTSAEGASGANGAVSAALSNGFTVAAGATDSANVNNNTVTYVGWSWKANGTAITNTSGSITSSVSANPSAGFSIVTYTGTGANATVGHGLGVAPSLIIVKSRSVVVDWAVYHKSIGNTGAVFLDLTNATNTNIVFWNNTTPTSSVFNIGINVSVNQSAATYVAYAFAEIPGFSKFGSYTGNGSTDGPFIYLGFRPRWLLIKRTDSTGNWNLYDSTRNPYNVADLYLQTNNSNAEASGITFPSAIDLLSNGFKTRNYDATYGPNINANGGTYIYMAFAENPFKNALAR